VLSKKIPGIKTIIGCTTGRVNIWCDVASKVGNKS
jgi:hypothetical protein